VRTTVKDDFYGELPVIERWHDCHHTRTGWSGIRENGEPVHMVYDPRGQGEPPGCDRDVHAREWPPARLTRGRRPLGVPRDRACNVVSDTMHETVTERLALQLVRQPARERHRVDQAAQRRGVSCRQSLSSLLAPTKR